MQDNKFFRIVKWIFFGLAGLCLLFAVVSLFTGCANKRELEELSVVAGIGVDSQDRGQTPGPGNVAKAGIILDKNSIILYRLNSRWKMKNAKILLCLLVSAIILGGVTGCKEKKETSDEYTPTSSLQMTESEAAALGEKVRVVLYFTDKEGNSLYPENQLVEFSSKDRKTENIARKMCEMLLAGPANTDTYVSTFPKGLTLKSVDVSDGVATVDFAGNFTEKISDNAKKLDLMMCALANTLTELKDVSRVAVTVEGKAPGKMKNGYVFGEVPRSREFIGTQPASSSVEYTEEAFADVTLE